jgi:signal transduction histidine kinase
MELAEKGIIHLLQPLEKDTKTRQIKTALQDAMQQLSEFVEEFLELFEDFNSKDQVKNIITVSKKSEKIIQSIENIIEKQMKPHFEKNILGTKKIGSIRGRIRRRARLICMLGA